MKALLCSFFLVVLCTSTAISQNWQLIPVNEPLFFRNTNGKNIGFEIVTTNKRGTDWVYTLSPSAPDEADLLGTIWSDKGGSSTLVGRIMVVNSNGNTWLKDSTNGDSLLIKPLAVTGNKWTLNARKKVTASVISMFTAKIKGLQDSVKLIQLSNGQQIVLSKNNGLWSTPNLYPINTNEVQTYGRTEDRRLTFRMVNDFDKGDIFHKTSSKGLAACTTNYIDTITDKVVSADGNRVTYTMQRVKEVVCELSGPNPTTERTVTRKTISREYNYSENFVFEALPNTLFTKPDSVQQGGPDSIIVYALVDSASQYKVPYVEAAVSYGWDFDKRLYISGAGSYHYISLESETDPYFLLPTYFKKGNLEWGKKLVIGLPERTEVNKVQLFPNPAYGEIQIVGLVEPENARILDITGKLHQELRLDNGTLSIASLAPGPYILALEGGRRISFHVL